MFLSDDSTYKSTLFNENKVFPAHITLEDGYNCIDVEDLVQDQPKLVFYFTELSCSQCTETLLEIYYQLESHIGSKNFIILASYTSIRDFQVFKLKHRKYSKILNATDFKLPFSISANVPFIVYVDHNLKTRLFYIPRPELPDLNQAYVELILNTKELR